MYNKLSILIEEDEHGFFAFCPELKGCQSQGDTKDDALKNIKEAIDLYLETLSSDDLKPIFSKSIYSTAYEVEFA